MGRHRQNRLGKQPIHGQYQAYLFLALVGLGIRVVLRSHWLRVLPRDLGLYGGVPLHHRNLVWLPSQDHRGGIILGVFCGLKECFTCHGLLLEVLVWGPARRRGSTFERPRHFGLGLVRSGVCGWGYPVHSWVCFSTQCPACELVGGGGLELLQ